MRFNTKLFNRDDRPLPKKGCSIAFYILLLLIVVFCTVMYVRYQNQSAGEPAIPADTIPTTTSAS